MFSELKNTENICDHKKNGVQQKQIRDAVTKPSKHNQINDRPTIFEIVFSVRTKITSWPDSNVRLLPSQA